MKENRINIGLFVCHLENEFSSAVSNGAMVASKKFDTNLIIFPGRYINGVYNDSIRTEYEYQYNTIFNYASSSNLDVLLVVTGTIGGFITGLLESIPNPDERPEVEFDFVKFKVLSVEDRRIASIRAEKLPRPEPSEEDDD